MAEPYSPFSSTPTADEDSFRPRHLSPPFQTFSPKLSSSVDVTQSRGAGIQPERFEALLQAARKRNAGKTGNLRKEVALRAQIQSQTAARRAIFLSKVLTPPSPTATLIPKTPPDSPAIFHYSLPSPGLVSPLEMFEILNEDGSCTDLSYGCEPWVEQVDFRQMKLQSSPCSARSTSPPADHRGLPSLDQISARLTSRSHIRTRVSRNDTAIRPASLLVPLTPISEESSSFLPVPQLNMSDESSERCLSAITDSRSRRFSVDLRIPAFLRSPSPTVSSLEISDHHVPPLDSRARRAHDMLSTLKRRTMSFEQQFLDAGEAGTRSERRRSAPADLLPLRPRNGFEHPVLSLPGGF